MGINDITHDRLQGDCFQWFHNSYPELRKLLWMNFNNPKNKIQGAHLKAIGLVKGVHDLLFYYQGKLVGFEIKVDRDKLSDDQRKFGAQIESQGGQWYEIRSLEQFQQIVLDLLNSSKLSAR